MKIELLSITPNSEKLIEIAGRTCYKSSPKDNNSSGKFIKSLIKNGHESILEHGYATFRLSGISRACANQLVRHRICSFSQQSQRYTSSKQFDYVIPDTIQKMEGQIINQFHQNMQEIQKMYDYWKDIGLKNEDARAILPNACTTEIVMSTNFREFRSIFKLRCDYHAQLEIREMCKKMLEILYKECPSVFEDLKNKFID